jgi:putative zinc finger protein
MQCRDARELLDSFLAEELLVETNHELLQHLAACPACQSELEGRSRLRVGLREAFGRAADLQLRAGFQDEIAAQLRATARRGLRQRWTARWLAVAASLLLVTGMGLYMLRGRVDEVARLAAGDHQNCAVKFALREKPISLPEAAARYDSAYAGLEHTPPDEVQTAAGTLHVADRHSCVFENRRFGHVVFKLDDHLVSMLMTADASSAAGAGAAAHLALLPSVERLSIASVHVPGHVIFVISDLHGTAFEQVAQSLAGPAARLAARLDAVAMASN